MLPENYADILRVQQYVSQMRPLFNKRAVFSDETEQFRTPFEPMPGDEVQIRIRTLKGNVDRVYLISGSLRQEMELEKSSSGFDYYVTTLKAENEIIRYYFELQIDKLKCFYNKLGVTRDLQDYHSFVIQPGFATPNWAQGAVMYQIFTDRFYNGDVSNDVETREYSYIRDYSTKVEDWDKPPALMGVREFYGGDIQGIIDKLDYLQDLGVEVLYLNPIFVSPSNHKYDIQDYDYVDPHYGKIVEDEGELLNEGDYDNSHASRYIRRVTGMNNLEASNQLFIKLMDELHSRGMKLILDGVFNHCGSFNKWLDREKIYEYQEGYSKGAFVSKESPYHSYFKFNNEHDWPYNEFYDGWWGHDTLPKLNYESSPELVEAILRIGEKWVSPPYNVDGWRLDVAADLGYSQEYNHSFWKQFRSVVKKANPNAIILAEHYGNPASWLQGDEWDTVMNYDAFMEPVSWFLTGMEKHSDEYRPDLDGNGDSFASAMKHNLCSFTGPSLQCAMNELSNHDHSRFLTRTNKKVGRVAQLGWEAASQDVDKAVFRMGVMMQMTLPGAPTLYYGDEVGVCGFTDPDNRRTYPWGKEDQELLQFHKDIIKLHKEHPALRSGSVKGLGHGYNYVSYGRFSSKEQIVLAVNKGKETMHVDIPVWETGVSRANTREMERLFLSTADGYTTESEMLTVKAGVISIDLQPESCIIIRGER